MPKAVRKRDLRSITGQAKESEGSQVFFFPSVFVEAKVREGEENSREFHQRIYPELRKEYTDAC